MLSVVRFSSARVASLTDANGLFDSGVDTSGGCSGSLYIGDNSEEPERFDEMVLRESSEEFVVAEEGLRLEDIVEAPGLVFFELQSLFQVLLDGVSCLLDREELIELERDGQAGRSHVSGREEVSLQLSISFYKPEAEQQHAMTFAISTLCSSLKRKISDPVLRVYSLKLGEWMRN